MKKAMANIIYCIASIIILIAVGTLNVNGVLTAFFVYSIAGKISEKI